MSKASGQATISQKDCGHYFASLAVGVTPQLHRRRSEKLFSRGARGLDAGRLEAVETREALSRGSSVERSLTVPTPRILLAQRVLAGTMCCLRQQEQW